MKDLRNGAVGGGGCLLPLEEARTAHEMLTGAPHKRGKIVLSTTI